MCGPVVVVIVGMLCGASMIGCGADGSGSEPRRDPAQLVRSWEVLLAEFGLDRSVDSAPVVHDAAQLDSLRGVVASYSLDVTPFREILASPLRRFLSLVRLRCAVVDTDDEAEVRLWLFEEKLISISFSCARRFGDSLWIEKNGTPLDRVGEDPFISDIASVFCLADVASRDCRRTLYHFRADSSTWFVMVDRFGDSLQHCEITAQRDVRFEELLPERDEVVLDTLVAAVFSTRGHYYLADPGRTTCVGGFYQVDDVHPDGFRSGESHYRALLMPGTISQFRDNLSDSLCSDIPLARVVGVSGPSFQAKDHESEVVGIPELRILSVLRVPSFFVLSVEEIDDLR